MFNISQDKRTQEILHEAAEWHSDMIKPFLEWKEQFFVFPRKCYFSGGSTGWFSKVYVGHETCKLKQLFKDGYHQRPPNRTVYARPEMYTLAQLKDDPRLIEIDANVPNKPFPDSWTGGY